MLQIKVDHGGAISITHGEDILKIEVVKYTESRVALYIDGPKTFRVDRLGITTEATRKAVKRKYKK